ncbi:sucrase ferredoxin [Dietzia cinnamea]|uniref:sucrase ferredoxin n=1 Tax=Dietzia cinnamea TaxID=321318 RepID=UPI000D603B9E|nr:sucrase ferredoxin [Dietzia cinnamea]PWD96617.1 sucrase ferredoxin [Dietzia maris]
MSVIDPAPVPAWCSLQSADEPPAGTAAHEESWVLLEVPARWGRDIFDGEALGDELSEHLKKHVSDCGSRMLFIRRPGREGQRIDRHRFYLCDTRPGRRSIRVGRVDRPADMLDLDLSPGGHVDGTREVEGPVVLVCTHAKRDQCCAVRGRPVVAGLESRLGNRLSSLDPDSAVWECSHTGGHRFAPVLLLPGTGYTYGPAETDLAVRIVEAELDGRVVTEHLRGRSTWPPAGQVAEVAVRDSGVEAGIDDLVVDIDPDDPHVAVVQHADGRAWRVETGTRLLPPRAQSCRKPPGKASAWVVESLTRL